MDHKKDTILIKIGKCFLIFSAVLIFGIFIAFYISDSFLALGDFVGEMNIVANLYVASVVAVCTFLLYTKDKK